MKLNLASGKIRMEGFTNVDYAPAVNPDVVYDLDVTPWPWEDDSVDEVHCSHYIEHTKDLMKFMNELYRIMKPGASAKLVAPYYTSIRAWQDPTHTRVISENTFLYYNKEWRIANQLDHYPIKTDFDFGY